MPKHTKEEIAEATTRLKKLLRPAPYVRCERTGHRDYKRTRQRIYMVVSHVSRSGMRREFQVYTIHKGEMVWLTHSISVVLGWSQGKTDGVKVDGCGMDMGFHMLDCLCWSLWGKNRAVFGAEQSVSANDFVISYL